MDHPLVSVIVPVKNCDPFLDECMKSVLLQRYRPLEVSLYDDGSTDSTPDICRKWAKILSQSDIRVVFSQKAVDNGDVTLNTTLTACGEGRTTLEEDIASAADDVKSRSAMQSSDGGDMKSSSSLPVPSKKRRVSNPPGNVSGAGTPAVYANRASALSAYMKKDGVRYDTGVAVARNKAVRQSTGEYLCFLDGDDVCYPTRVELLVNATLAATPVDRERTIFGSCFTRIPEDATPRYSAWSNSLISPAQLLASRFRECTVAMPTWFMARSRFVSLGMFDETDWRSEDLLFFYKHLEAGGTLYKIPEALVKYRWLPGSASFKLHRLSLLQIRTEVFERTVLWCDSGSVHEGESSGGLCDTQVQLQSGAQEGSPWRSTFCIVGFGRDGKQFYNRLSARSRARVRCFIDADERKVGRVYVDSHHGPDARPGGIPVVAWDDASAVAPAVCCVALGRTDGRLESLLAEKQWVEGADYFQFT